jgi:DNA-binding NtrC family response regulator
MVTDLSCLVVAADRATRALGETAARRAGLAPRAATTAREAILALEGGGALACLVSQDLGPGSVREILARARAGSPPVPTVVLGAEGGDAIFEAASDGAGDFVAPPLDERSLARRLKKLLGGGETHAEPEADLSTLGLIGRSKAMKRLCERIGRIARFRANVLLLGESGTGKEVVARALHACGRNSQHLFVPLNCAAFARDIVENELFGHEKGAFTGANERKRGLFELADGGTIFLDEIGEMELSTQAKLLRVLERNEFRRVGGAGKIKVDVNVIAASNRDLERAIADGRFRRDLYYRLKVVTLVIPPLRDRRDDIPLLVESFIRDFNARHGAGVRGISPRALERLMAHDWPGNVRELKNAVESAAIFAPSSQIGDADIVDVLGVTRSASPAAGATLAEVERRAILDAVERCSTKAEAARSLGIGLRTLYTKLSLYETAHPEPGSPRRRRPQSQDPLLRV